MFSQIERELLNEQLWLIDQTPQFLPNQEQKIDDLWESLPPKENNKIEPIKKQDYQLLWFFHQLSFFTLRAIPKK
jgi:hypothetical protein